ncbi:MAG: EAL domain-containing protein [Magnetococcales bacterium]|nr:EAL domain-containing protein [Magnetococcales bacterium]
MKTGQPMSLTLLLLAILLPTVLLLPPAVLTHLDLMAEAGLVEERLEGVAQQRRLHHLLVLMQRERATAGLDGAEAPGAQESLRKRGEDRRAAARALADHPTSIRLGLDAPLQAVAEFHPGVRVVPTDLPADPETLDPPIARLLTLLKQAAHRSGLLFTGHPDSHQQVQWLILHLPRLLETLNRVQALGSRLSGRQTMTPGHVQRLDQTLRHLHDTWNSLAIPARPAPGAPATAPDPVRICLGGQAGSAFQDLTQAAASLAKTPGVTAPMAFFSLGETAAAALLDCTQAAATRLEQTLARQGQEIRFRRWLLLSTGLAGLVALLVIPLLFYRRHRQDRQVLQAEQDRLTAILDSAVDGLLTIDSQGVIRSGNRSLHNLFGYPPGFLIGKKVNILMPHPHGRDHDQYLAHHLTTGEKRIIGTIREVEGMCVDGGLFPLELSVGRFQVGNEMFFTGIMHDITARKQSSKALAEAYSQLEQRVLDRTRELETTNQRLTAEVRERVRAEADLKLAGKVFDNASEGILITTPDARIVDVNPAYTEITGFTREEVLGTNPNLCKSGRHDDAFYQRMWQTLKDEGHWTGEIWDRRKNGEIFPKWLTINAVKDAEDQLTHYVGIFSDITHIKATEQRLEQLAYYDPLTGLPNRMLFRDRLEHEMAVARRNDRQVGVFFIDLDRFKHVNDTLGHAAGDQLLVEISRRIVNCVRRSDTVSRLGGDEFTVILSGLHHIQRASHIAGEIIQALQNPVTLGEHDAYVGASIGIAIFPNDGEDFDTLTKNADLAMYQAKEGGRGTFRFFEAGMNAASNDRLKLEGNLRRAVQAEEFTLFYQPKLLVSERRVIGAEALVRWQRQDGMVSPARFIPLAEETGLIIPLGDWILHTACRQTRQWLEQGYDVKTAVNLAAPQFTQEGLPERIGRILEETGLPPAHLELEVTESMVMINLEQAITVMGRLKEMGLSISLDDFGTGYSSLSYLKRFPLRALKIDQSFVRDLTDDSNDAAIVTAIISLGRSLGLRVVAEGVETEAQLAFLAREGCNEMQGYLTGRPMPPEEFERVLAGSS